MHPRLTCLLVVCLLLAASITPAQVPETMTVQGRLTDDAGAPLEAGNKDFEFKIYKGEATPTQIWPGLLAPDDIQTVYTDADGFWTAQIGTVAPLNDGVFNGAEAWLEIAVSSKGGLAEILPRIQLHTSPFSFRVGTIDGAEGGRIVGDVEIEGALDLGDATHEGCLNVFPGSSVNLGSDAVAAYEILDEPGLGFLTSNSWWPMHVDTWTSLRARSITVPTSGYILAIGSFVVECQHVNGEPSYADFALTSDLSSISSTQESRFALSVNLPSGYYDLPTTLSWVFTVESGTHTVHLAGEDLSNTISAWNTRLTLLFVPTAYGEVEVLEFKSPTDGDERTREGGLTQAEIDQERADALAFNQARLEQELEVMRSELDAMKARMETDRESATENRE